MPKFLLNKQSHWKVQRTRKYMTCTKRESFKLFLMKKETNNQRLDYYHIYNNNNWKIEILFYLHKGWRQVKRDKGDGIEVLSTNRNSPPKISDTTKKLVARSLTSCLPKLRKDP